MCIGKGVSIPGTTDKTTLDRRFCRREAGAEEFIDGYHRVAEREVSLPSIEVCSEAAIGRRDRLLRSLCEGGP